MGMKRYDSNGQAKPFNLPDQSSQDNEGADVAASAGKTANIEKALSAMNFEYGEHTKYSTGGKG